MAETPSLIDYPSAFPIKVMGENVPGFRDEMLAVARLFDAALDVDAIEERPSSGGRYLGLTITLTVHNREQLDDVYRALSGHPMVKVVL